MTCGAVFGNITLENIRQTCIGVRAETNVNLLCIKPAKLMEILKVSEYHLYCFDNKKHFFRNTL